MTPKLPGLVRLVVPNGEGAHLMITPQMNREEMAKELVEKGCLRVSISDSAVASLLSDLADEVASRLRKG